MTCALTRSVRVQEDPPKSLAPPMNHRQSRITQVAGTPPVTDPPVL